MSDTDATMQFEPHESFAKHLDTSDDLAAYRQQFLIPKDEHGTERVYFASHSLGLQSKRVQAAVDEILSSWALRGVEGYFEGDVPWYRYTEPLREPISRLIGATPDEVVLMNTLTVNLHLMMVTFYRPTKDRYKILMEDSAFPSDTYAAKTQLRFHGFDPDDALIVLKPRPDEHAIRTEDIEKTLAQRGSEIALVLFAGVQYFTGQVFEMGRVAAAARRQGCAVGLDLAHAVGNVPLDLHAWDVDFAVWCSYKYLSAGPGAAAGCFVHERHARNTDLGRFGGWWGNDPDTRFRMHLQPEFIPRADAFGWQLGTPPMLAMAPCKTSYELFGEIGLDALRRKSVLLTAYLQYLIDRISPARFETITPREPDQRGCQLSLAVDHGGEDLLKDLKSEGVVCDFRQPNVIRAAPVPLYNTFHEVWRFAQILARFAQRPS